MFMTACRAKLNTPPPQIYAYTGHMRFSNPLNSYKSFTSVYSHINFEITWYQVYKSNLKGLNQAKIIKIGDFILAY